MNIELQEIFCCHDWAIEPIAGRQLYNALMAAIANQREGRDVEGMQKTAGFFLSKNKSFAGKLFVGDIHRIENRLYWNDEELAEDDQIINVVVIEGAVTRNGGACTYGSKEHRDQILYANTIPQVVGHLFLVNTPGGMVMAGPDYDMAFEDCRANNKPTAALIDGICYSMGEYIVCQCDYILAMNPEDGFGCIGTMSVGEIAPHGSINSVTQERTIILVGRGSPDKNREIMEAATGNDELMQAKADTDTERFHEHVRKYRPQVTDDLLTGKTFPAREVMGKLVDEIGGMDRAIEVIFQLADGSLTPARNIPVTERPDVPDTPREPDTLDGPEASESTPNNNDNNMTQEELKAAEVAQQPAAAQEETPAVEQPAEEASATEAPAAEEQPAADAAPAAEADAEETQEEQPAEEAPATEAPAAEEQPAADAAPAAEADAEETQEEQPAEEAPAAEPASQEAVEEATAELDRITETLHSAERMIEEKDATIANLKAEAEGKDNSIQQLQQTLDGARHDIETANATIAARDKSIEEKDALIAQLKGQVADLRAEVKELAGKPAPMTDANAGVPQDNGTGEAPKTKQKRITRENMTYAHCREVATEGK